ncbi:Uncharacterized protein DAT39_011300, partial [Clarias magur]
PSSQGSAAGAAEYCICVQGKKCDVKKYNRFVVLSCFGKIISIKQCYCPHE